MEFSRFKVSQSIKLRFVDMITARLGYPPTGVETAIPGARSFPAGSQNISHIFSGAGGVNSIRPVQH